MKKKTNIKRQVITVIGVLIILAIYIYASKNEIGNSDEGEYGITGTSEIQVNQNVSNETGTNSSASASDSSSDVNSTSSDNDSSSDATSAEANMEDVTDSFNSSTSVEYVQYYFRNDKLLSQHYEKHGIDMGFASKSEYEKAASDVVNNPDTLHKTEAEDGDDIYYVEATNEFVVVSTDGYIRTYFNPDAGIDYYNRQ